MKKTILPTDPTARSEEDATWFDLDALARIRLTSEDATHPIESALGTLRSGGWRAAQPGRQTIWISFEAPQDIRQISVGFAVAERRTHEFVLSWSGDGGVTYHEIVRQQFNFSPTTPAEDEDYFPSLKAVTDLKLVIIPDISDSRAHATLSRLRLR